MQLYRAILAFLLRHLMPSILIPSFPGAPLLILSSCSVTSAKVISFSRRFAAAIAIASFLSSVSVLWPLYPQVLSHTCA